MINKLNVMMLFVMASYVSVADAYVLPQKIDDNPHIQTVNYDDRNVFKFYSAVGIVTTLEFDKQEKIINYAMGDSDAWNVSYSDNILVLKPAAKKGSTNLTVYTEKSKYFFWVQQLNSNSNRVPYLLKIRSKNQQIITKGQKTPEMLAFEKREAEIEARRVEVERIRVDLENSKNEGVINRDYWVVGHKSLDPVAAEDNGVLTRLTFSADQALPVAFVLEEDGVESIVDSHMEGDTMVLHRVAKKIILRRGNLVAGITNKNHRKNAMSSPTGTVSNKVDRVVIITPKDNN